MSIDTDTKDSSDVDWLEQSIANGRIKCYDGFKNIEPIGKSSSGSVVRVNWKDSKDSTDQFFVLKSFKNDETILKEVINEV